MIKVPVNGIIFCDPSLADGLTEYLNSLNVPVTRMRPGYEKDAEKLAVSSIVVSHGMNFCRFASGLTTAAFFQKNKYDNMREFPFPYMRSYSLEDGSEVVLCYAIDVAEFPNEGSDSQFWSKYLGVGLVDGDDTNLDSTHLSKKQAGAGAGLFFNEQRTVSNWSAR